MKNQFIFWLLFVLVNISGAQGLKVSMDVRGENAFVSDYWFSYLLGGDQIIPNLNTISAFNSIYASSGEVETKSGWGIGIYINGEKSIDSRLYLFGQIGYRRLNFDSEFLVVSQDVSLRSINSLVPDFGRSRISLLNAKVLGVSYELCHDKVKVKLSPSINYLIKEESSNAMLVYGMSTSGMGTRLAELGYFIKRPETRRFMYGASFDLEIKLLKKINIVSGFEYSFSHLYKVGDNLRTNINSGFINYISMGLQYQF